MAFFSRSSSDSNKILQQALRQLLSAEKHAEDIIAAKDRANRVYLGRTDPLYGKARDANDPNDWRSRLFEPVAFEHIEMLISNMCDSPPVFSPEARLDQYAQNTAAAGKAMNYYLERDCFARTYRKAMRRAVIYGGCPVKVVWKREMCTVREPQQDPLTGAVSMVDVQYPMFDGPTMIPLDYRDFFPDPTAKEIQDAGFVFHRWRATLDDLKSRLDDDGNPFYENLDQLVANVSSGDSGTKKDNETQEAFERRTLGMQTIHERWTRNGCLVIANRTVIIRHDEDPLDPVFKHRKVPFGVVRIISDDDNLGGVSIPLLMDSPQEAYWKWFNEFVNAVTLAVRPPMLIDEDEDANAGSYDIYPDARIPTRNGEATTKVMKDIAGLDKYAVPQVLEMLRDSMERTSGMNASVAGSFNARNATSGTNALTQSMKRLTFQIDVSDDDWSHIVEMAFELVQQFADKEVVARLTGGGEIPAGTDVLLGQFAFTSKLATERALREQKQNSLTTFFNAIVPMIAPGTVEFTKLSSLLSEMSDAYQVGDLGAVSKSQQQVQLEQAQTQLQIDQANMQMQQQMAPPPEQQQAAPAPETQAPHETISLAYDKAPPSIQRQIEQMAGFKPATAEENALELAKMRLDAQPKPTGGSSSGSKGS